MININNSAAAQEINAYKKNASIKADQYDRDVPKKSIKDTVEDSAFNVTLSMNAQIILYTINASDMSKGNSLVQGAISQNNQEVLDFLSGNTTQSGMSLSNIGYEGKPLTELTTDEANELISDDGFFGVTQTSDRVANFVFSFSGDDIELLQKGREGIVQGFEEAKELFGGTLPEISYQTQERTLQLIDEKIASLTN